MAMQIEDVEENTLKDEAASLFSPLHQVPTFPFNYASFYKLCSKSANKGLYQVGRMRLRLPELQVEEQEARKVKAKKVKTGLRSPYQIGEMRLRLQKLQVKDQWAGEVQSKQDL